MGTLPENIAALVCQHYAADRQLASLGTMMRLNRRLYSYARALMYKKLDLIDDRTSRFLEPANAIHAEYEGGALLDDDILGAIDCRDVDPLDLDPPQRWLRSVRQVQVVEIKDMLYGRDVDSLYDIALSLAKRDVLLLPNLKEIIISQRVVRRVHAAGSKHTPMISLVCLFLAARPIKLHFADSAIFRPPPERWFVRLAPTLEICGRSPPHPFAHISHTVIQFMDGMPSLQEIRYDQVDPNVPVKPCWGVKHILTFRPLHPRSPVASSSSFSVSATRASVSEAADLVSIRTAVYDIIVRSAVAPSRLDVARDAAHTGSAHDRSTRQSSWLINLPFAQDSPSSLAQTFVQDLHDKLREKYLPDEELLEQIFANLDLRFNTD